MPPQTGNGFNPRKNTETVNTENVNTDNINVDTAPTKTRRPNERSYYPAIIELLNKAMEACDVEAATYNKHLRFFKWDRPATDYGSQRAAVYPDIIAVDGELRKAGVAWNPQGPKQKQVRIPVEVKDSWADLMDQLSTYALPLFSAEPLRRFALGLAYNHAACQLRFVVFHRGGALATTEVSTAMSDAPTAENFVDLARLCTWLRKATEEDCGLTPWFNNEEFHLSIGGDILRFMMQSVLFISETVVGKATFVGVAQLQVNPTLAVPHDNRHDQTPREPAPPPSAVSPKPAANYLLAYRKVTEPFVLTDVPADVSEKLRSYEGKEVVVKFSWTVLYDSNHPDYSIEANALAERPDSFGCQKLVFAHKLTDNRPFLPTQEELTDYGNGISKENLFWKIGQHAECPTQPEIRQQWLTPCEYLGHPLAEAGNPWTLFLGMGHSALGWLSKLADVPSYFHRDPSYHNVYLLACRVKMLPFDISAFHKTALLDHYVPVKSMSSPDAPPTPEQSAPQMTPLEAKASQKRQERDEDEESCMAPQPKKQRLSPSFPEGDSPTVEGATGFRTPLPGAGLLGVKLAKFLPPSTNGIANDTICSSEADRLQRLIEDLGITDECFGIISDFDQAVKLDEYFEKERYLARSGTLPFMSHKLRHLAETRAKGKTAEQPTYLQSPVDDLEAFYHSAVWAVMYHNDSEVPDENYEIQGLRRSLSDTTRAGRDHVLLTLARASDTMEENLPLFGQFRLKSAPFLFDWSTSLRKLTAECTTAIKKAHPFLDSKGSDDIALKAQVYIPLFCYFAFKGVANYFQLLIDHRESLEEDVVLPVPKLY